jgi:hypothetical protein
MNSVDRNIKRQSKLICPACGPNPTAGIADGNMTLVRLLCAGCG